MGVGFYESNDNSFNRDLFINKALQVVSVFSSLFVSPSGVVSSNKWESGQVGNYWNDYSGHGEYEIDHNNVECHPLSEVAEISSPTAGIVLETILIIVLFALGGCRFSVAVTL